MSPRALTERIKSLALDEGFDVVGVAQAGPVPRSDRLATWLDKGFHADMQYMAQNLPLRLSPNALVEGAVSVICLASSYAPSDHVAAGELIARYARGRDYHRVLKKRCIALMDAIRGIEPSFEGRAFVDSAPVMERSLAAASGVGWIGRNGCLIVPGLGSYVMLSEIISNLPLEADRPLECQCQECGRCVAACPTGALNQDGLVDARRCISYLTTENRGQIDPMYWARMGQRVLGCDACQQACPCNFAVPPGDPDLQPGRAVPNGADLSKVSQGVSVGAGLAAQANLWQMLQWTQADFDVATAGTAIRRATYNMFLRNAVIASGNSRHASLLPLLARLRGREGIQDDLLDWAISRLESLDI